MENYILIRHSTPNKGEWAYYKKGKIYTYEEYSKLVSRKQLIKDSAFMIVFGVIVVLRAYVFFEYGI